MTDDFDLEDAPMARRTSSRVSFIVAMIAMLCVGLFIGVALEHTVLHPPWRVRGWGRGAGGGFMWHGRHGGPPRLMDDRMARALSLTPDQRVRVDSIVTQSMRRVQATQAQIRPQMREIFTETRARIDSVLTAKQRERLRTLFPHRDRARADSGSDRPP